MLLLHSTNTQTHLLSSLYTFTTFVIVSGKALNYRVAKNTTFLAFSSPPHFFWHNVTHNNFEFFFHFFVFSSIWSAIGFLCSLSFSFCYVCAPLIFLIAFSLFYTSPNLLIYLKHIRVQYYF